MRAFAWVLCVVLAGCAAPGAVVLDEASAARTLPWRLSACEYVVAWSSADPDALQARLLDGFTVSSGNIGGVLPVESAVLGTEAFACESGSGIDADVGPVTYGSMWFSVQPPAQYVVEGVEFYFWKEEVLVPDDARRALLAAAGLSVRGGDATVTGLATGGRVGDLALAEYGTTTMTMASAQTAEDSGAEFIEFTPTTSGGVAVWRANYSWDESPLARGRGFVEWPEGSWAAEAVGGARTPASFHAGKWSFHGTLTLPAS